MHIWLTIYNNQLSATDINQGFAAKIQKIPTLSSYRFVNYEVGGFSLFSWTPSARTSKTYLKRNEEGIFGYSGTIIDVSGKCQDMRHIDQVSGTVKDIHALSGQFAIFQFSNTSFRCWGDNLGTHKVFYLKKGNQLFVSNNLELLVQVGDCELDLQQYILQKVVADSGGHIGYKTHYKGVAMLPEHALITAKDGELAISEYADLQELLNPKYSFEDNLEQTIFSFRNSAKYLRRYHDTVVPLSGGFDSRVVLAMFWGTNGRAIHTFTYNRQSNLDFVIASKLSREFNIPHVKIVLDPQKDRELLGGFDDTADDTDIFDFLIRLRSSDFYNSSEIKVVLTGNGGGIDWPYHFNRTLNFSASGMDKLLTEYSQKYFGNALLREEFKEEGKKEVKEYMQNKYGSLSARRNFIQLFGSGIFHFERFRNQGMDFSQRSDMIHDTFHPYGTSDFLKTVFSAEKENLMRGNRSSIHYLLYKRLTVQHAPYAPLLRENNWNDGVRKIIQKLLPLYAKVLWKLQEGDVNTVLRRKYAIDHSNRYKEVILSSPNSKIWDYFTREAMFKKLERNEPITGVRMGRIARYLNEDN